MRDRSPFPLSDQPRKCGDFSTTEGGVNDYTKINGPITIYTQYTKLEGRGGDWSQECYEPGLLRRAALYRQFLTGTTSTSRELQDLEYELLHSCPAKRRDGRLPLASSCGWAANPPTSAAR